MGTVPRISNKKTQTNKRLRSPQLTTFVCSTALRGLRSSTSRHALCASVFPAAESMGQSSIGKENPPHFVHVDTTPVAAPHLTHALQTLHTRAQVLMLLSHLQHFMLAQLRGLEARLGDHAPPVK